MVMLSAQVHYKPDKAPAKSLELRREVGSRGGYGRGDGYERKYTLTASQDY